MKINIAHQFRSFLSYISPVLNTKICYIVKFKKRLNLNSPQSFNEKVLWLKLNTYKNNPLVKKCADKLNVREYIKEKELSGILNKLIAIYSSPNEIEWDKLPDSFAMKLNVGCGCNLIVRDKSKLVIDKAIEKVNGWFKKNLWAGYSELQYKDVKRYIIVEDYIGNPQIETVPSDYKFYCMNGKCKYILVCKDRGVKNDKVNHAVKYYFLNRQWEMMPYTPEAFLYPDVIINKPECLDEAIEKAEILAKDFPFVRVDFFIENKKIYFGELTFTPAGAMDTELLLVPPNKTISVDMIFGKELNLPNS